MAAGGGLVVAWFSGGRAPLGAVLAVLVVLAVAGLPGTAEAAQCPSGRVAVTFDDGPGRHTAAVLSTLATHGVPATFFVVGNEVARKPELTARAAAEGHVIANHTAGHERLTTLSDAAVRSTVERTDAAVRAAGAAPTRLVRPPYGATDARVRRVLAAAGYGHVLWTIDPQDWRATSAAQVTDRVLRELHDRAVVVLHDGHSNSAVTVAALPALIEGISRRGYCFGVLDAAGAVVGSAPAGPPEPVRLAPPQGVEVVAGSTRVETAVAVSRMAWPDQAPAAVLVSAARFPDALAAATLAGVTGAPLLLTGEAALPAATAAELHRLRPAHVHAVGPLDDAVVEAVEEAGIEVTRIRGRDRYATAELLALAAVELGADASTVYVATGEDFADALGASVLAAAEHHPVLLVHPARDGGRLAAAVAALGASRTVVIGGRSAVPDALLAPLPHVERVAGPSRAETAAAVAEQALEHGFTPWPLLASGDRFPDALAGGVAAAALRRPLLITSGPGLSPAVHGWVSAHGSGRVTVLGGLAAVPPRAVCELRTGTRDARACP